MRTWGFHLGIVFVVVAVAVVGVVVRPGGQHFELELEEVWTMLESLSEIVGGENFEAVVADFAVVVVRQTGGCVDLR